MADEPFYLEIQGHCPICETGATFIAKDKWYRGSLHCQSCENGSAPRERAMALVLNRVMPHWRDVAIHECAPMERGLSAKMRREATNYVGTHYFPSEAMGTIVNGWRNENIEQTTFSDASFDLVITSDVTEHVFNPGAMFRDIYRTLKPGGIYISTFPIRPGQTEGMKQLAALQADGTIKFLKVPPEYHGNPINGDGALVTWDFGYEIHELIAYWTKFSVEISRFSKRENGIIGAYTEVILCRKPFY